MKLPKFKVSTAEILESGKTPEELGAELIFKALTARDGEEPSDEVLAKHVGSRAIVFGIDSGDMETQILRLIETREMARLRMQKSRKNKVLRETVTCDTVAQR